MSTGTRIIQDALKLIGAHSVVSPAGPESIEDGRVALNSMLEMWNSKNIQIGTTPLEVAGDELNEPADCRNAIVQKLAIEVAPLFDNGKLVVSPELRALAKVNFQDVRSLYGKLTIPRKVLSSTTPTGAGNSNGNFTRRFWPKDSAVGN